MVKFKVIISDPKQGKSLQKEVDSAEVTAFKRRKIGDKIDGKALGYEGYELEITGGSDNSGFPMRKDVEGIARKRILIVSGVGLRKKTRKGMRKRKTVAGNTISLKTAQINLKVIKYGKAKLEFAKKEAEGEAKEAPKEEKTEEKPKEEVKEEKPKEEVKEAEEKKDEAKPEEKKEEKPKEAKPEVKKEEPKKEDKKEEKPVEKKADKEEVKEKKKEPEKEKPKEEQKPGDKEEKKE